MTEQTTDPMTQSGQRISMPEATERARAVLDEVERAVVGKRVPLTLVLSAVLAKGHVLIEDFPGLAKTLIARSFAAVTGLRFARVQFTPDLMPSDITGSSIYDQRTGSFSFRPGPIFTHVLLGDEINRAPPKTQAALLEAMEERQVTSDDATRPLDRPFLVIATQNPIEYEGTYPLPEAQLDRFLARVSVGYPGADDEWEMLERRIARRAEEVELRAVVDRDELLALQRGVEDVHVAAPVGRYIVAIAAATRASTRVQVGASPRGTLALMKLARARAALAGRDYVVPDDVKALAVPALAHRLVLNPELWVRGIGGDAVVRECLEAVPAPDPAEALRGDDARDGVTEAR
jgi:MoxR-like ATPase